MVLGRRDPGAPAGVAHGSRTDAVRRLGQGADYGAPFRAVTAHLAPTDEGVNSVHDAGQPFPCPPWCSHIGCAEHSGAAIVHREFPEPPLAPSADRGQLLTLTLEQHDDPHGIQPGQPFAVLALEGTTVMIDDPDELGRLAEMAAAARMKLLEARGEPVVPIPRRPRHGSADPRRR
ncbi:DUF6907 domain-containing protein [Actinomycetospora termitidis]|uniref:DUF6907 domain-containing protein n=1 Tax=Actinomycetospora termitidis TaxID=3053470 RepID=UPI003CE4888C